MSDGNRLYLACRMHPTREESYLLGDRAYSASYEARAVHASLQKWLDRHANCGGGFDHFTVAYHGAKDDEQPTLNPIADAVHIGLHR